MANDISGNLPIAPGPIMPGRLQPPGVQPPTEEGGSFKDLLVKSLDQVNAMQQNADTAFQKLATGQTDNVTEVLNAVNKADLAFKLLMQIRNQLVEAYSEVEKMNI
jgi:flagellar hook-basal body complex protein FliE